MSYRIFEGSTVAKDYALYRPTIPDDVTDAVLAKLQKSGDHETLVVDIGCGSGQFTQSLARHFDHAIGFDISEGQIEEARSRKQRDNVEYGVSSAETIPVETGTVDLVAVSQAAHWFDFPAFSREADRILRPGGHIVVVSTIHKTLHHHDPIIETRINECNDKYMGVLDTYRLISIAELDSFYGNLQLPFAKTNREKIGVKVHMSAADYLNLIKTMSYSHKYKETNANDTFFEEFEKGLKEVLETSATTNNGQFQVTFWHDITAGQKVKS